MVYNRFLKIYIIIKVEVLYVCSINMYIIIDHVSYLYNKQANI